MIHGDPVFTNIFIKNNTIKFIDMNGTINTTYTIYGDYMYDYAKIYQSLLGYDELLHNSFVSHTYKSKLLKVFWENIPIIYHRNIKILTLYLIITLLPLHEDANIYKFINLANELFISINIK